jgi:hypothetical protein
MEDKEKRIVCRISPEEGIRRGRAESGRQRFMEEWKPDAGDREKRRQ